MYARRNSLFSFLVFIIALLVMIFLFAGCSPAQPTAQHHAAVTHSKAAPKPTHHKAQAKPKSHETFAQKQAIRAANTYLSVMGYSKQGLEDQLVYDKFSRADAKYAVNHLDVNWNEQAYRSARDLLNVMGYSPAGLVSQLETYGKFTHAQAVYGAHKAFKEK